MAGDFAFKDIYNLAFEIEGKLDVKGITQQTKDISTAFAAQLAGALKTGIPTKKIQDVFNKLNPLGDRFASDSMALVKRQADLQEKIGKATITELEKKAEEADIRLAKHRLDLVGLELQAKQKAVTKEIDQRKDALIEYNRLAARGMAEAGEELGDSLEKSFESLKGGDFASLLKGAGKRIGARGAGVEKKHAEAPGGMGKIMGVIGQLMSRLGPVLMAVGAIVAGFASIVTMVIAADSAAKELNRSLLTGSSGMDLVSEKTGDFGKNLDITRNAFAGLVAVNRTWGTTAEDHIGIMNAYSDAGWTFSEITGNVEDATKKMKLLTEATEGALVFATLLGETTSTIAQGMGEMMEEMALTQGGVMENFSKIASAAKESGFATKRFFNMVLQTTSGMAMYNVRLEDTVGLMLNLVKVLGAKAGTEMMNTLNQGFKGESTTERTTTTLLLGKEGAEIARGEAVLQAATFGKLVESYTADAADRKDPQGAVFKKALDESGLGKLLGDPDALAEALHTLSKNDSDKLYTALKTSNADLAGKFRSTWHASMGMSGTTEGVQAAMEQFGASATMLVKVFRLKQLTGKRLDEIDLKNIEHRAAVESQGLTSEQFRELLQVSAGITGMQGIIKDVQEKIGKAGTAKEKADLAKAFTEQYGKQYNFSMLEGGQINSTATMDLMETEGDKGYKAIFGNLTAAMQPDVDEQIKLAKEIADNTTEMSVILQQGVQEVLMRIYSAVSAIKEFVSFGEMDDDEKQRKVQILDEVNAEAAAVFSKLGETQAKKATISAELRGDVSPERKIQLQDQKNTLTKEGEALRAQHKGLTELSDGVRSLEGGKGWFRSYSKGEILRQGAGKANIQLTEAEQKDLDARKRAANNNYDPQSRDIGSNIVRTIALAVALQGRTLMLGTSSSDAEADQADKLSQIESDFKSKILLQRTGKGTDPNLGKSPEQIAEEGKKNAEQIAAEGKRDDGRLEKLWIKDFRKMFESLDESKAEDKIIKAMLDSGAAFTSMADARTLVKSLMGGEKNPRLDTILGGQTRDAATGNMLSTTVGQNLNTRVNQDTALKDALSVDAFSKIRNSPAPAPPVNDAAFYFAKNGQVSMQRLDNADQVAVASKSGGALSQAAGRGGGVVVNNHHYYNDAKGVYALWQRLQQARVLG